MATSNYTKREIDSFFSNLSLQLDRMELNNKDCMVEIKTDLHEIKVQTQATNGRVTRLEAEMEPLKETVKSNRQHIVDISYKVAVVSGVIALLAKQAGLW